MDLTLWGHRVAAGIDIKAKMRRYSVCAGALPLVLAVTATTTTAYAACSTNTPADNSVVECTAPGADTVGVAGNDNITVNVRSGALIEPSGLLVEGIDLQNGAKILVEDGAEIDTTGNFAEAIRVVSGADIVIDGVLDAYRGIGFGTTGVSNSTITVGATGQIGSTATAGFGIDGGGGGNSYQINGTIDTGGDSAIGINVGDGDILTIASGGVVRTRSDPGAAAAIRGDGFPTATGVAVTLDEGGLIETFGSSSPGVQVGDNANVMINGAIKTAQINPSSIFSSGANGVAVGGSSTVVIGSSGSIQTSFSGGTGGQSGIGIFTGGGGGTIGGTNVTVNGQIQTFGQSASGVQARQQDTVIVGSGGSVTTNGLLAYGIFQQPLSNAGPGTETVSIDVQSGGNVTTHGGFAHGVYVNTQTFTGTDTATINIDGDVAVNGPGSKGIYLFPNTQPLNATIVIGPNASVSSAQALAVSSEPGSSISPFFPDAHIQLKIAGTVSGLDSAGLAIDLNDGEDTLELQPGFSITGLVSGGTQAGQIDGFVLGGTGTGTFNVSLIDGDNTPTASEQFRDFETFGKSGSASWTLNGTNTEIAAFSVNTGKLINNATMPNTVFTISADGTLGGTGVSGGLVNSGTVAPGNSIGSLSVAGDATFEAGSTFEVEVANDGTSDLIDATGSTAINGGTVTVVPVSSEDSYADGQRFTILRSTGGVAGQFEGVTDLSAFLDFALSYDPNTVYLTLTKVADFASVARTFNQFQVAGALQTLDISTGSDGNSVATALLGLDAGAAPAAFDSIQGEIHADSKLIGADIARLFNSLLLSQVKSAGEAAGANGITRSAYPADRVRRSFENRSATFGLLNSGSTTQTMPGPSVVAWGGGFGSTVDVDGDGNAAEWTRQLAGFATGLEFDLSDKVSAGTVAGVAAGYSHSTGHISARRQAVDVQAYHMGVYGRTGASYSHAGFAAQAAASYAFQQFETHRSILFAGVDRTATAEYDGHAFAVAAQARYGFAMQDNMFGLSGSTIVAPLARLDGRFFHHGRFTETGASSLNLSSDGESFSQGSLVVGLEIEGDHLVGGVRLRPSFGIAYELVLGAAMPSADLTLAGSPTSFSVRGPNESRNRLRLDAALSVDLSERATLNVSMGSVLSTDRTDIAGNAVLKIPF